ncbi:RNA-directed DNA polymerase, eukaryota [Tanacetum coccineum]
MSSFAVAKTSRVSKSLSKLLNSHGSMIDAFISHIEIGNVLGYDMEDKCKAIAKLCNKHKVAFLGIQETSGGLVSIWDPNVFSKLNVFPSENLLIVEGIWKTTHIHCFMINVYTPQDDRKKEMLWHNILDYMERNPGHYFIFGDFNVVRHASERIGTVFNPSSANVFNQFILDGHLWDVPLGGHLFTRVNNHGDKLSKLDRFLITESTTSLLHNYSAQVLDCHISDHRPIFLSPSASDFGPIPLKFYNSWLTDKHLHDIVVEFWEQHDTEISPNPIMRFRKKMKALKPFIREWSKNRSSSQSCDKEELIKKNKEFDDINARRTGDIVLGSQRITWITDLRSIESNGNLNYSQKAKIKLGIEADKNSKFFHATVNQKRRYLSIHRIKHEGQRLSKPHKIKDAFYSFFKSKFQRVDVVRIVNRSPFYRSLHDYQNSFLVSSISETEIRDAIWDCGSDKSPGPDRFTFAFYKKFWDTLKEDVIDSVISQEQSAFIKNRQILDGPLMVSEAIQWCKRKKTEFLVFKIYFEKAFDSISWDFLLQVMRFMGFNDTCIKWISGCLFSATSSILINGSPTLEFNINRGLRQGDPLSPFLFIIAMEGLHVALEDAIAAGLYRCEWSRDNITSLVFILECFHRVFGLKINYNKSNLFGVGVPFEEVSRAALITGCNAMQTPFSYLGLPIDCNMANVKSWDPIVDKFSKRLSKWKSSMLSIGGKATLISSVLGSIGTYYLSLFPMPITVSKKLESIRSHFFWGSDDSSKRIPWISWNLVLASKGNGGLGIGSLYSLNQALIQKWRWRFFNNPHSLWVRLLTSIHGDIDDATSFYNHVGSQGVWGRIVGSINTMHKKGFIPYSFLKRRVNNGASTKFWYETWVNNSPLQHQYPRLFRLALNKECSIQDCWNNGKSSFTVKTTRGHIDQRYLPNDGMETRWNRFLPKKINIFIWRVLRDRLPTRWNLSRKGIDVDSLSCPVCDAGIETIQHSMWFCSLATTVWHRIFVWLHISPPNLSNLQDLYSWIDDLHISSSRKIILETICGVVLWTLWNFRNETIFGSTPPKRCILIDKILDFSYSWYSTRNKLSSVTWNNWLQNPLEVSTL